MSSAKVRVYGRFVFAERYSQGSPAGEAVFVAPVMSGFAEHTPLLTMPRQAYDKSQSTIRPDLRFMSDNSRAPFAEMVAWKLDRRSVGIAGSNDFTLAVDRGSALVSLPDPVGGNYDGDLVQGWSDLSRGFANSTIKFQTGTARAYASIRNQHNVLTKVDATDGDPGNDRGLWVDDQQLADVVDVLVSAPANTLDIAITGENPGKIVVLTDKFEPMVSVTHLCGGMTSDPKYDLEFEKAYSCLSSGIPANVPIPTAISFGGDPGDCNVKAYVRWSA